MPLIEEHVKISLVRTGKEYRGLHEWLDKDPALKAERHDLTKIFEYAPIIEERFGKEGLKEYLQHLQNDIKAKFEHLRLDFENSLKETMAYFGIKKSK